MNDLAKPRARSAKVKEAKPATSQTARPGGSAKAEVNALPADTIAAFDGDADFVASLARGLAVLLAFSQQSRRMTIAQVSHRTGLPRAAVRRSLHTLAQLGYVASDDARGFSLRPKVLALGNAYLASTPLALAAQPVLDRLSDRLQESCSLGILDGDEMVYLARSTSSRILSPSLNVGSRLPANSTSIGQVLLAYLPAPELDGYLARVKPRAFTDRTVTSEKALRELLQAVRQAGHAIADQQIELGLRTMAVPVRDTSGAVVAGMNVIVQAGRVPVQEMASRYLHPLQDAAQELGMVLLP